MEFFKAKTQINFMRIRYLAALVSTLLIVGALVTLVFNGVNWGLQFTGGTEVHLVFSTPADLPQIRKQLVSSGFSESNIVVQSYGSSDSVLIRVGKLTNNKYKKSSAVANNDQDVIVGKISTALPQASIVSINYIGPQVGKELANSGALALFIAVVGTAIYIALRFEYRLAISAAIALLHDPIIIMGYFSFFHVQFDLIALAAVLTVIGYSLNDTIVVFDRMRENFRKVRKASAYEVVNLSVNETLSRTIMTSGLTLIAVLALFFFGGPSLHGFAMALLIGIVVGTYSSIYVAGSLAVSLGLSRVDLLPKAKYVDDRP